MRLEGEKIEGLNEEFIVLPRKNKPIVLRARAISSYDEFDIAVAIPKPPTRIMRGGKRVANVDDPGYQTMLSQYATKRTHWMILKSLQATPTLEWETINMNDPETWDNFQSEMRQAGFSEVEMAKILQMVLSANGLDETKLEKAREDFLLSQEAPPENSYFQEDERAPTQSGAPANASESDRPE